MMKAQETIYPSQTSNAGLCLYLLLKELVQIFQLVRFAGISYYDVERERQQQSRQRTHTDHCGTDRSLD